MPDPPITLLRRVVGSYPVLARGSHTKPLEPGLLYVLAGLQPFWRTDWFVGVLVVAAVLMLHRVSDVVDGMERRFYDLASTSTTRQPSSRIAIIAIDDQSIANLGRWPWLRDVHAKMIDLLAAANAKVIAYTVFSLNRKPIGVWLTSSKSKKLWLMDRFLMQ